MRRPALAALALSLLALLFGWETRQALRATPGGQNSAATAEAWQPGVSSPDPKPPPDPTAAAAAVAARPLFRPDRQPFREPVAGVFVRNYEAELSRYTLLGVLGFGDAPYGVVVGKAGGKGERWEVRKGDSLPGFAVKEVEMEGLRLTADDREFQLPLYAGPPRATGGALRTEVPRVDASRPSSSTAVLPVPRGTASPAQQPSPARPAAASPLQGASPQSAASPRQPVFTPKYVPGRR